MAATGVAAVGIGYGFKLAAEGAGAFAKSLEKLNPAQLEAMKSGLLGIGLGLGGITLVAAGLAASGVGPAAIAVLLGVGAGVSAIGFGVKMATDGVAGMITSIGSLATVDLGKLGGFFSSVEGFMNGDTANLDKLVATVNALSQSGENAVVQKINELLRTPLKLEASTATFQANIDITTQIGEEKIVNRFAKAFQAKIIQATKGSASL
jgi:hypothetical protein